MDETESELELARCMGCGGRHVVAVMRRDRFGVAIQTLPLEDCQADIIDELLAEAGKILSIALDARDWELAEKAASALSLNDPPVEEP